MNAILPAYERRNERAIFAAADASGQFPEIKRSFDDIILKAQVSAKELAGVEMTRRKNMLASERMNYQLELERLQTEALRRVPGLRGHGNRMGQLETLITDLRRQEQVL